MICLFKHIIKILKILKNINLTSEFVVFSIKVRGLTLLGTLIIGGGGIEVLTPNIMYGGGPLELIMLGLGPI